MTSIYKSDHNSSLWEFYQEEGVVTGGFFPNMQHYWEGNYTAEMTSSAGELERLMSSLGYHEALV